MFQIVKQPNHLARN